MKKKPKKTPSHSTKKPAVLRGSMTRGVFEPGPQGPQGQPTTALLKLDLGCGPNKQPDHTGVDVRKFPGVDVVLDLGKAIWPWANESVAEAHSSHFLEHLTSLERIHFMNELHRVLVPGGKCKIIVPIWSSSRAYGDPTHQWPPIGEMTFLYLNRVWRATNAPHTDISWNPQGFKCDFEFGAGYSLHASIQHKSAEVQQHNVTFYKEAAQDIIATITKVKPPPDFT